MRDRIIRAVTQWNEEAERSTDKLIFTQDLKEKHLKKIQQGFGKQVPVEEWIAIYDKSITGNGKKGCIFTKDMLYLSDEEPIVIKEVCAVYEVRFRYFLEKTDGTKVFYKIGSCMREALPVLQRLCGIVQEDCRPMTGYEELHTTYRRELHRRMNEVTKRYCEKNHRFVSIELASAEFVENALLRWPQIDRSEILGFLKTVKDNGKEAIVITEEAIYSGTDAPATIYFDGLKKANIGEAESQYVIYDNHYTDKSHFYVYTTDRDPFNELIHEYISIYHDMQEEIASGNVIKSGLDLMEAWNRYQQKKEERLVDTYKNAVFVSSTFRDMHFERDIIHEKVQPALSALADGYGESISFCDLRWGVNTEDLDSEEGAKKVLIVCLDEIEKCDPYMLIMLGERYGWIPSEQTIKNALENRPDFTLEELENSVTALEIEFGALSKQTDKDRIFVYFREMDHVPSDDYKSEDEHHAKKLFRLKERVRKLAPDRVKTYRLFWNEQNQKMDGVDAFAQMVIQDIGQSMERVWSQKENVTAYDREMQTHLLYMKQKAELCCARDELLKKCLQELEDGAHLMALTGVSGCGKSTVMGALSSILKEGNAQVLPIFCGLTGKTESALGLVQYMAYSVEQLLGWKHFEEQESVSEDVWLGYFSQLVETYSKEQDIPLFIMIDAVDQLTADHMRNSLKFIPGCVEAVGSKVYMILSCLDDFDLAAFPNKIAVPMLDDEAKPQSIQGILKKNRRELDDDVFHRIMKKGASDSPLYLNMLIQRLLMMNKNDFANIAADGDGMSAITKHQLEIIEQCGEDISSICMEMIQVAAERIGGDFVKQAIEFISVSQHGLRESDLEGLLLANGIPWNRLEFSLFINYLRTVFVLREDGCYDFSHKIFRQEFMCEPERKKDLHKKLFMWLEHLPEQDFMRERELLYHCIESRETKGFMYHVAGIMADEKDTKELNQRFLSTCRKDRCRWLIEMIRSIKNDAMAGEEVRLFLKYVTEEIGRAFDSSESDLKLREDLFMELLPVAEYLVETEGGLENRRRVSVVYSRLGMIHKLNQDYVVSEEYFKKALLVTEDILKDYNDHRTSVDLSVDYRMLANLYLEYEDEEHKEKAVSYYKKSIELGEAAYDREADLYVKRMLSASFDAMGDYYHNQKQSEKALEYYMKCRQLRVAIVEEASTVQADRQLAYVLQSIGDEYKDGNKEQAARYYDELIACRERIVQGERTMSNMVQLAWAYNDAGEAYYALGQDADKATSLNCYEKCISIFEEDLKQNENLNKVLNLADVYQCCVKILSQYKDVNSLKKMEKYAHRALELYEYRAKKENIEIGYMMWFDMLSTYEPLTNNRAEKRKCLETMIQVLDLLYESTKKRIYKKMMAVYKLSLASENMMKRL